MEKHYDKHSKLDAAQYYTVHKVLGLQGCETNLGTSLQTLSRLKKELQVRAILKAMVLATFLLMMQKNSKT